LKSNIVAIIFGIAFLLAVWYNLGHEKKNPYWENIGPTWDKMLNPCKYENCK